MVFLHEPLGTHGCPACGFRGVPVELDTPEDWRRFAAACLLAFWARAEQAEPPPPDRGPWSVCSGCGAPWVRRLPDRPGAPRVACALCGHEGEARTYPNWRVWSRGLRPSGTPAGPYGEPS